MKHFVLILSFLAFSFSQGQEYFSQNEVDAVLNNGYFHDLKIEKFFLHTNKNLYFTGENLRFKAYVAKDDDNTPYLETANLHLNVYDLENKLIMSKLFYVQDGTTSGMIELPKDLKSGRYHLQLDTQWNRNFKKGSVFPIQIVNPEENPQIQSNQSLIQVKENVTVSFRAANGTILENMVNTLVYKIYNAEDNTSLNCKIIDMATGIEVVNFDGDPKGFGSLQLFYASDYKAFITIDGKEIETELPKSERKGFILKRRYALQSKNSVSFELLTNDYTINSVPDKKVMAVLHRHGSLKSIAPVNLKIGKGGYIIDFLNQNIFKGLNTITLFDSENRVVGERNFLWKNDSDIDIKASIVSETKDSITLKLSSSNTSKTINSSISVNYSNSKSVNDSFNISNSFEIEPYLQIDTIETEELTDMELDLVLQTESNYKTFPYKNINSNNLIYASQNGFNISGKINTEIKASTNYTLMLNSEDNNLVLVQPFDPGKNFKFENLYFKYPSSYKLALFNEQGEIQKAKFYIYDSPMYQPDSTLLLKNTFGKNKSNVFQSNSTSNDTENSATYYFPKPKDLEALKEVVITASVDKQADRLKELIKKNPNLGLSVAYGKNYFIDEDKDISYSLGDYLLKTPGLRISKEPGITKIYNMRTSNFQKDADAGLFAIYLDGMVIDQTEGLFLVDWSVTDFELISINASGAGYGLLGGNGVINLISRKISNKKLTSQSIVQEFKASVGYEKSSAKYEGIQLVFPNSQSEIYFECIDWIPNFDIKPNFSNLLTIKKTDIDDIKLIVNGFTEDGDLVSESIPLSN